MRRKSSINKMKKAHFFSPSGLGDDEERRRGPGFSLSVFFFFPCLSRPLLFSSDLNTGALSIMPVVCAAVVGAKVRLVQKKEEKEKVFRIEKNVRAPLGDRTQKITLASSTTTTTKQNNPLYLETFSPSPSSVGIISDAGDAHGGGDGDGRQRRQQQW